MPALHFFAPGVKRFPTPVCDRKREKHLVSRETAAHEDQKKP
jgi:hypothetical protein